MKYIIGMDGGGTATYINVCTTDGELLREWKLGPLNINGQTYEDAVGTVEQLFAVLKQAGFLAAECEGVCVGAAGISNADASVLLQKTLLKGGIRGKILLAGDHETALAAAAKQMWGIILIAGTGSICYGKDQDGKTYRAGGYGHIIDDSGSAYAIGRDILKAVVRGNDGRDQETSLREAVFAALEVNRIEELITWIYAPKRTKGEIAALAVLLEEEVGKQDFEAGRVLKTAVEELVKLARAVLARMGTCETLVLGGSVLLKNSRIEQAFRECMGREYKDLQIVKMKENAAKGAVNMIRKELGLL